MTMVPEKVFSYLISSSGKDNDVSIKNTDNNVSRKEFDSHANMIVVGENARVVNWTGRKAKVQPYSPNYEAQNIPIVDATILYECPYSGKRVVLVVRDSLYVKEMEQNLTLPFIMRETGIIVRKIPKIHGYDPSVVDHAITFNETGFRIPLSLFGIFSYFPTTKPTINDLNEIEDVYVLSPPSWNPHNPSYAESERHILVGTVSWWNGGMMVATYCCRISLQMNDREGKLERFN